jgi:hypothetical protein
MDFEVTAGEEGIAPPPRLPLALRRAWFVAAETQDLPPLATTALHGALGRSLRAMVCTDPSRPSCRRCPRALACAYPHLYEAQGDGRSVDGVTTSAPAALALSPDRFEPGAPRLRLEPGEPLSLRLCLVGRRAATFEPVLAQALARAGDLGLGLRPDGRPGRRPRLELQGLEAIEPPAVAAPTRAQGDGFDGRRAARRIEPPAVAAPTRALLEWQTPVRLVADGKVASSLDASRIWRTVVRRVRTLARLYGDQPAEELPPIEGEPPAPFAFEPGPHRIVRIDRYSARQGRRMTWPGLVGSGILSGPGLPAAWPWLRTAEALQLGKATSFGFGRLRLLSLPPAPEHPPAP